MSGISLATAIGLFPTKRKMELAIADAIARKVGMEVVNYSALPSAVDHDGEYVWVLASQGTKWLPGTLGGTYYPKGLYYSAAGAWQFADTPINATQNEVNAGTDSDTFVSPHTLANTPLIAKVQAYADEASFPATGTENVIYVSKALDTTFRWDTISSSYKSLGGASTSPEEVDISSTYWYVGYSTRIDRIDPSTYPTTKTSATTTDLATDWPNRASLTYV